MTFTCRRKSTRRTLKAAAAMGVTLIINNRPDGEMIGQPKSEEIEAAASRRVSATPIFRLAAQGLPANTQPRFKTRLTIAAERPSPFAVQARVPLWFAHTPLHRAEWPIDQIVTEAAEAGYDVSGHAPAMSLLQE